MIRHQRVVAGPYRIHSVVGGTGRPGPPIVLVHGLGVSHRYMLPTLRALAATREVHAVDLPGFGLSPDPPDRAGLRELARSLAWWLDRLELERPVLLGNSLGCHHIVAVARDRPVTGLVLAGPTVDPEARTWTGQAVRLLRDIPREPLVALLRAVVPAYLRAGPVRILRLFAEALGDRLEEALPEVTAPVVVVRGERDPIATASWCRHLASLARAGTAREIAGAGHAVNFSHPGELAELTRRLPDERGVTTGDPRPMDASGGAGDHRRGRRRARRGEHPHRG